jgi:hypothetical protein
MICRYVNLASVKPNQREAVKKHGVLRGGRFETPGIAASGSVIFAPLPETFGAG